MAKNRILCVIDAQNDFIDGALANKEAQEAVPALVEQIAKWTDVIIVTKDTHEDKTYLSTREGKYLPTKHCIKGTKGWEINKDVEKALENSLAYPVVEKSTFGSFALTDTIKKHCKVFNVSEDNLEIYFAGFCTDICVISNAILAKAAFPEASITVISNCCAGTSPSAHKAALVTMKSCQISIVL